MKRLSKKLAKAYLEMECILSTEYAPCDSTPHFWEGLRTTNVAEGSLKKILNCDCLECRLFIVGHQFGERLDQMLAENVHIASQQHALEFIERVIADMKDKVEVGVRCPDDLRKAIVNATTH